MRWIRYVLLIGAAAGIVGLLYLWRINPPPRDERWIVFGIFVFLALNLYYLWVTPATGSEGRLGRLFRLWLDAKETELRSRAKPPEQTG